MTVTNHKQVVIYRPKQNDSTDSVSISMYFLFNHRLGNGVLNTLTMCLFMMSCVGCCFFSKEQCQTKIRGWQSCFRVERIECFLISFFISNKANVWQHMAITLFTLLWKVKSHKWIHLYSMSRTKCAFYSKKGIYRWLKNE